MVRSAFPDHPHDGILFNHCFMSLPDDYRVQVVADGITSFDAAIRKVRNLLSALRVRTAGVRQLSAETDVVAQFQKRIEELERRLEAGSPPRSAVVQVSLSPPMARRQRGGPPPAPTAARGRGSPPQGVGRRRLCYACENPGHLRSVCRHRAAVCYSCGEPDRLASVCHSRSSENTVRDMPQSQNRDVSGATTECDNAVHLSNDTTFTA